MKSLKNPPLLLQPEPPLIIYVVSAYAVEDLIPLASSALLGVKNPVATSCVLGFGFCGVM
jgi:hypothetical protein